MKRTLPFIAIIIALVAYAYAYGVMRPPVPHTTATTTPSAASVAATATTPSTKNLAATSTGQAEESITITVASSTYTVGIEDGENVIDAMQALAAQESSFTYTGEEYPGMGYFVESIDGKENGSGSYWFLYVNGTSSNTGASATAVHPGDAIEWRYEKSH